MNKLIAKDKRISLYKRKKISKALIAAIIALIIAIMGIATVSAYRNSSGNIIEYIEQKFSTVTDASISSYSSGYPETIETEYTLPSIPNGYKRTYYNSNEYVKMTAWTNDENKVISFSQYVLDSLNIIDNEHGYKKIKINGYPAYINKSKYDCTITWSDGNYWFTLQLPNEYYDNLITEAKSIVKKQ
ncbi:MAG: DUF4367 domain-containing protein [Eubacterium sp.]|nr:DUF4367 domain-containing protein [Eubacterium sp.]